MERKIIKTEDGSTTIHLVDWGECYHSKNGAIQEAYHVFINNGLSLVKEKSVSILEMGFGTGLNAFVTLLESEQNDLTIDYVGIEAYPISDEEIQSLNYVEQLNAEKFKDEFSLMHNSEWGVKTKITENFTLTKRKRLFQDIDDLNQYDIVYFDAFGYPFQPELWSEAIFVKMFNSIKEKGILVTYAARGVIKRAMQHAGFQVKKVPGPPGKREMFIAFKNF
ncbi:tRNA (5-methylaminomethyl-2-thiouridine)(34)-methyltransferase MnmD [Flavobacterium terrae]|uniref:tRNA U34 5-methylaminomethyl-2-thiouridine-forming methyltransferase MnmC n=1 Tax=Flavobacterium terrae TaxID=415425 RepID=A0A1M6HBP3_9FLAO|nr:tRNA (5-methylaminomethyl-2-thiouridine)(34)-methyltransferase MnmD [Flavobacterium terrae]SHJ19657.1 tRNA U34 5-methylaminomethyl-2-thiouridine-forming methyltransferase MnmC [Flavobacterium terrae]